MGGETARGGRKRLAHPLRGQLSINNHVRSDWLRPIADEGEGISMTMPPMLRVAAGATLILACLAAAPVSAQQYVYPAEGQSPEQQRTDEGECHAWAVQSSGFDPANPTVNAGPAPQYQYPTTGAVRGAARGAAGGAIGGAIAGNAGKGAAIGAATGAFIGGIRRREQMRRNAVNQQQYQQQQQAALSQGQSNYSRAFAACMQGRGYTVR